MVVRGETAHGVEQVEEYLLGHHRVAVQPGRHVGREHHHVALAEEPVAEDAERVVEQRVETEGLVVGGPCHGHVGVGAAGFVERLGHGLRRCVDGAQIVALRVVEPGAVHQRYGAVDVVDGALQMLRQSPDGVVFGGGLLAEQVQALVELVDDDGIAAQCGVEHEEAGHIYKAHGQHLDLRQAQRDGLDVVGQKAVDAQAHHQQHRVDDARAPSLNHHRHEWIRDDDDAGVPADAAPHEHDDVGDGDESHLEVDDPLADAPADRQHEVGQIAAREHEVGHASPHVVAEEADHAHHKAVGHEQSVAHVAERDAQALFGAEFLVLARIEERHHPHYQRFNYHVAHRSTVSLFR